MSITQERLDELALEVANGMNPYSDLHKSELIYFARKLLAAVEAELIETAKVANGPLGNRLMWATEEAQQETPVGTKLIPLPLIKEKSC